MDEVWGLMPSLEEIRLHRLFHVGFGKIIFFKWHDVINSNSWFLANIKRVFRFDFIQAIIFYLKLNTILTKIDILCVKSYYQSARPTHPLASIWRKLWEDSICIRKWPLKQTDLVFASY